jgi:hypothetical protein
LTFGAAAAADGACVQQSFTRTGFARLCQAL